MAKKREHESEHSNSERWLLSYADFITLLMIFFVVMYSMSTVDKNKFQQMAQYLGAVFGNGNPTQITSKDGGLSGLLPDMQNNPKIELNETMQRLEKYIEENKLEPAATIRMDERGLVVSLNESLLFKSGSADVGAEAATMLSKITNAIIMLPNYVRIEGFTDNVPINTARFPSNWELASQRAINVMDILISNGLEPAKVSAVSYGEHRPEVPNDTPEHRQLNRRVDIVIIKTELNKLEPTMEAQ